MTKIQIVKKLLRTAHRRCKYGKPVTLEQVQAHLDNLAVKEGEERDLERIKAYFSNKEWED